MTTVWVFAQAHEPPEWFDTELQAVSRMRQIVAARPSRPVPVGRIATDTVTAVVYPIDVEPPVRGHDYWNRDRKAAA